MILLTICLQCWNISFLCFSVCKFHIAVQKLVWLPPSQVGGQTWRSKDMYPQLYSSVVRLGLETCLTFMHWYGMKPNGTKYYGEEVNANGDIKLPVPCTCNILSFDLVVQLAKSRVPASSILFFFFFKLMSPNTAFKKRYCCSYCYCYSYYYYYYCLKDKDAVSSGWAGGKTLAEKVAFGLTKLCFFFFRERDN